MRIQLISDIHLEFGPVDYNFNYMGEAVTVIAGDLDVGAKAIIRALEEHNRGQQIVYVFGNHEFYGRDFEQTKQAVKDHFINTNIHILDNSTTTINDVTFIGSTLWTNFRNGDWFVRDAAKRMVNDFRQIRNFPTTKCEEEANKSIDFIKCAYEGTEGKKVIVTHFLPAVECIHPRYQGQNVINGYFANDLGGWISGLSNTPLWLFGHTHDTTDVTLGGTRCFANPYGYYGQNHPKTVILDV